MYIVAGLLGGNKPTAQRSFLANRYAKKVYTHCGLKL